MKKITFIFLALLLIYACNSNLRIEKRRYMKGYYINFNSLSKNNKQTLNQTESYSTLDEAIKEKNTTNNLLPVSEEHEITILPSRTNTSKLSFEKNIKIPIKASVKKTGQNAFAQLKLKKITRQKNKNTMSYFFVAIAALLMGYGIKKTYESKKTYVTRLKNWSVKNKRKAFLLSVATRTLLMIIGIWSGVKLFELDYLFPKNTMLLGIVAYSTGLMIFLFRKSTYKNFFSFLKAKLHSLVMATVGFILFATIGNTAAHENSKNINQDKHLNKRCAQFFESKKQTNNVYDTSATSSQKNDEDDTSTVVLKAILMLFTILSIIVLEALALVFSCVLMCEGNEVAGVALAFGGSVFLAALSIITIYWITKIDLSKNTQTTS